ncbi:MAG: hypothetical protein KKB66_06455 [Alphaproteobacteria bacterium]|nr:hypothetical protein [Alphaproteobacteria bacterium]MBU0806008.1 hypothetical protein [Alphaproteobacteria bacterium]MBU0874023.1 hypothetical protein [Alphaproteobacteria bacterium]MBU1402153.1 hypothetical protein [Alphaproteobacteria bacterium]MBU1590798.1 hypothetical protein [Alphaproteobacteria bacterium]
MQETRQPNAYAEDLRIGSLAELNARLEPRGTIICLGNGPSSEDSRLAGYRDATVFRVNWIWTERNWFGAPDMVFTSDPDLVRLPRQPVLAFPTAAIGEPILRDHLASGHLPSSGFVFFDHFDPSPAELGGAMIPTNGALMVALAAALRPRRIVIAGIDLYRHPKGKYPGAPDEPEGYARQHSADVDLGLIGCALAGHRGDTDILSDNLRDALNARKDLC